ncbi:oligosaccharide flippase family protein [Dictyobacter formicarum]|uniref:Polysaccharide biosynthesis protein C-terminal domain-containing protein n=1 Tax=Dictyobacter formicarum TaxID=2778368 RepID=A0ABQ3VJA7_9CHLR|nr:polysaccharide biosynthesis C-terminal domain-containing protein [Dictyobacter formicarum]GHO86292.1 hypothetical protein KSZ_42980 [Dictyobacter formicarum]
MSLIRARKRLARQDQPQLPFQHISHSGDARIDNVFVAERVQSEHPESPVPALVPEELMALCIDMSEVVGGGTVASAGYIGSTLVRYAANILMARMVSPAIYGMFGEIFSLTYILGWVAKLGFDIVFVRLLPHYRLQRETGLMTGLTRFILLITMVLGIFFGLLFWVYAPQIALLFYHDSSCALLLQEATLLIPLIALQTVIAAGLQAFKEVLWKMYIERLLQPILTLLMLSLAFLLGWKMEGLSISTIVGYVFSVVVGHLVLRRIVKRHTLHTPAAHYQVRCWLALTLPMFFNGLVYALADTVNALLLGLLAIPSQAAGYLVAERAAIFITMPLAALSVRYTPLIAEYYYHGLPTRIMQMYAAITRWSVSLSLPVFLWFLVFRQAVLEGFGAAYAGYGTVLIIVCIGFLIYAVLGPASYIFVMVGSPRLIMVNSTLSIGANIVLSFILIQHYGALGAALGIFFSSLITYGLSFCWVGWYLKMQPFRWKLYKPLLAGGLASLIGYLILHCIQFETGSLRILATLGAMILFIIIYCSALTLLRFSPEDLFVFARLFGKFNLRPAT